MVGLRVTRFVMGQKVGVGMSRLWRLRCHVRRQIFKCEGFVECAVSQCALAGGGVLARVRKSPSCVSTVCVRALMNMRKVVYVLLVRPNDVYSRSSAALMFVHFPMS